MRIVEPTAATNPLQRVRLRWLVFGVTLAVVLVFLVVAGVDRRAAPLALAACLFTALHGLFWLLVLRRHRARLRRNGFRW